MLLWNINPLQLQNVATIRSKTISLRVKEYVQCCAAAMIGTKRQYKTFLIKIFKLFKSGLNLNKSLKVLAREKTFSIPFKYLSSSEYLESFFKSDQSSSNLATKFENIDGNIMELLIGFMKNGN